MKDLEKIKKLNITYSELDKAMKALGFTSKVEKSQDEVKERLLGRPRFFIGYYDKKGKLFYPIIQKPDETAVSIYNLFHITRQLCDFGFIEEQDDFIKMIEKNRLKAQKAAA